MCLCSLLARSSCSCNTMGHTMHGMQCGPSRRPHLACRACGKRPLASHHIGRHGHEELPCRQQDHPARSWNVPWNAPDAGPSRRCSRFRCDSLADGLRSAPQPGNAGQPAAAPEKTPLQQRILNGILGIASVPYSSYVAQPLTPLHYVDARVKLIWLMCLFVVIARASPVVRFGIAAFIASLTILCFPTRLWTSQLKRVGILCALIFLLVALGTDGVAPLLQSRTPAPGLEGLPPLPPPDNPYHYVIFHFLFINITQRSLNLAITAATLTFAALQTASLCLVTTPGEEMAMGLRWYLRPLQLLRVPVNEIALTLLLSLRFMSLVFEEVRNLCLGLAARGINWKGQGLAGSLEMFGQLCLRLFGNLFRRSEHISEAMVVRGFTGAGQHTFHMMKVNPASLLADAAALLALLGLFAVVYYVR